jgi:hypothetical protein
MGKKGGGVEMGGKEKKRPTLPFKKIAILVLKISQRLVKKRLDLFQKNPYLF